MAQEYKKGDKVRYRYSKDLEWQPAKFICYYDSDYILLEGFPGNDLQADRFFLVYDHVIEPYYETQVVDIIYSDLRELLRIALEGGYGDSQKALNNCMTSLGFEVPEDE